MFEKSRRTILENAITDWAAQGVITPQQAARMQAGLPPVRTGPGFRGVMILLGCACLCAALITFVAANWESMSRLARAGVVFAALWSAWGLAIWAGRRAAVWWFEGLTALACVGYGAAIMLVAQIYHIQGNAADAVWLWAAGTLLAAALLRGQAMLALAIVLFFTWFVMGAEAEFGARNWIWLASIAIGAGLAWVNRSRLCAHLVTLSLAAWFLVALFQGDPSQMRLIAGATGLLAVAGGALFSLGGPRWLRGFEAALLSYVLMTSGGLVLLLAFARDLPDRDSGSGWIWAVAAAWAVTAGLGTLARRRGYATTYDIAVTAIFIALIWPVFAMLVHPWVSAAAALAMAVWVLRMGWRLDIRALRSLGLVGFILSMMVIYAETLGSLIGTAGFYLGAGLILLAGAWGARYLRPGDVKGQS